MTTFQLDTVSRVVEIETPFVEIETLVREFETDDFETEGISTNM